MTLCARQSTRPAKSFSSTVEPMACASAKTSLGKCSGKSYWRRTESMSTPSASGAPRTSTISPSGLVWRDSHSRNSTTTLSPTRAGRPTSRGGRHINVVRHARIVGNDVERIAALRQRADNLRAFAFENADDRAGFLIVLAAKIFPPHVAPHEHAVFVQRRAGGAFGNGNFLEVGIVRLEKSFARAVHADAAGNQIRVVRQDVAVALMRAIWPARSSLRRRAFKFRLPFRRHAQMPAQIFRAQRDVILLGEQM